MYFFRMAQQHVFLQRLITVGLGLGLFRSALSQPRHGSTVKCFSVHSLKSCNCCSAHRARSFHFLLVRCVLKCCVGHTQRRTYASLNYSGTPLIQSPMDQKNLALLTRVFFTRKCMVVFARQLYYQGGHKAGFHCTLISRIELGTPFTPSHSKQVPSTLTLYLQALL